MKSNKQTEILEFIQYKIENEGYSPSIREIAEKLISSQQVLFIII